MSTLTLSPTTLHRSRTSAALAIAGSLALLASPAALRGATVYSTIVGSNNLVDATTWVDWHSPTNWSPNLVPNNSPGGNSFETTVFGGVVHQAAPGATVLDRISIHSGGRLMNHGSIHTSKLSTSLGGWALADGGAYSAGSVENHGVIATINANTNLYNVRNEGSIVAGPGSRINIENVVPGLQPGNYTASNGSLRLVSTPTINGRLIASTGSVELGGTLSGTAEILANSYLVVAQASIVGTLLTDRSKVIVHPYGQLNLFSPFENGGEIHVTSAAALNLFPSNPINSNQGLLRLHDSVLQLANADDYTVEYVFGGGGTLQMDGARITNWEAFGNTAPMLVNSERHTLAGSGSIEVFTQNRGTIKSSGVDFAAGFENQGALHAEQGLTRIAGGWRNLNGGTLSGGQYEIASGAELIDLDDGVIVTNAAYVVLHGKSKVLRYDGRDAFQTLELNQGALVLDGHSLVTAPSFTNTEWLRIDGSVQAGSGGPGTRFLQERGTTSGERNARIVAGDIILTGGKLAVPRLYGDVLQTGGELETGGHAEPLAIWGSFTQLGGVLRLWAAEPDVLDTVLIAGHASLDGMLEVLVADLFPRTPRSPFQLMAWASFSGRFRHISIRQFEGLDWFADYRPDGLFLSLNPLTTPTPEPATFLLSGLVLAAAGLWRHRTVQSK